MLTLNPRNHDFYQQHADAIRHIITRYPRINDAKAHIDLYLEAVGLGQTTTKETSHARSYTESPEFIEPPSKA